MTTIVADKKKKRIYGDTQITCNNTTNKAMKVFKETLPNGEEILLGVCGSFHQAIFIKDFIREYGYIDIQKENIPKITRDELKEQHFCMMIMKKDGTIFMIDSDLFMVEYLNNYLSLGSGSKCVDSVIKYQQLNDIKVNIPMAMKVASEIDIYTNDEVYYVSF